MAISSSTFSTLALALDGQAAGSLRSVQPASLRVNAAAQLTGPGMVLRSGQQVVLGEMAAEADLVAPGPLVDWLQALLDDKLTPRPGAVLLADTRLVLRRRIGFSGARLSGLTWPVLNAADGKHPFTVGLRWLADAVDDAPASGQRNAPITKGRKAMQTGNFRLQGLPFGDDAVSRVQLPAVTVDWSSERLGLERNPKPNRQGQRQLGELLITVGARRADAARGWVHKLVADGRVDDAEGLGLQLDLLDATLKSVLATVRLDGCQLRGLDEGLLDSSGDKLPSLSLRFAVAGMALTVA